MLYKFIMYFICIYVSVSHGVYAIYRHPVRNNLDSSNKLIQCNTCLLRGEYPVSILGSTTAMMYTLIVLQQLSRDDSS